MSFKSHIPFHRQISGSLIFLYLSFIFIIGITSFLLYQRNVQINELVKNQIPELEFVYQYKEHLKLNSELILVLNSSESSDELAESYKNIKTNLTDISHLDLVNVRNVNRLIAELGEADDIVERIVLNDSRNKALKKASVVQLGVLISTLITQIELTNQEQLKLHKKVTINGENGYIPAGYAIQYVEATRVLNQLNKSLALLDEAIAGFELLSIKYSVAQLESITYKVDLAITNWLSALSNDPLDIEIRAKIETLQTLLNVEQRVLGKWYSHLRLSEEVFNRVALINQKLLGLYPSHNRPVNFISSDHVIPSFVVYFTESVQYSLTIQEYYYGLIGLLFIGLLSILIVLFRFRTTIKVYGENTVELCASILSNDSNKKDQAEYVKTAEQLRIVGLIQQIQKPEHSESEYQKLQDSYDHDLTFIKNQHDINFWQYKPHTTYIDIADFLLILNLKNVDKNIVSWRHLFNKESLNEIISIAKDVRDSKRVQSYSLKLESDTLIEISIGFDGTLWFGTLFHDKKLELLESSVKNLEQKNKDIESNVEVELLRINDKFNQMILRTMIQSQGSSVDINGSTLPVYRQLTRMLDWCGQTNIVSQLKSNPKSVQNLDITFKEELHAIVINAMSEARFQRNEIYLKLDKLLLPFANIEHVLFHKMLTSMFRVILAELFNAKMLLELQVVDTDKGNQTIQFTFTISTAKQLKVMPELVNKLVNEDEKSPLTSNIIVYLNALMQRFNINQVQSALNDNGFNVIFNMPLAAQDIHPKNENIQPSSLENISIISLGSCEYHQTMIKHNLTGMNCEVIKLNSVDELTKSFTDDALSRKPIALIIVNDDITKTSLDKVKAFQMSLPENVQPKVFVMQSSTNAKYHKQGLYNQASVPLFRESFQNKVNELLNSEALDNMLIDAEVLSQYQHLPSRVELLLAVSAPESHQVLISILQWLGLQVHVVSQPSAMLNKWKSGRYLLLLSEFSESPFVTLLTGKNVQRGIFTFKDALFTPPTGRMLELTKHWKVSTLPNTLDIKALITLLEPWLKPKTAVITQSKNIDVANVQQHQSYNEFFNETNKLDDVDKEYLNQHQLLNLHTDSSQENDVGNALHSNVLDMEKYALNQGSSELAAYMLDEYLSDIDIAISDIEEAISKKARQDMEHPIQIILKLSEVMGAKDLNTEILFIKSLFEDSSMNNDFSIYKELIAQLTSHLKALERFSEAI